VATNLHVVRIDRLQQVRARHGRSPLGIGSFELALRSDLFAFEGHGGVAVLSDGTRLQQVASVRAVEHTVVRVHYMDAHCATSAVSVTHFNGLEYRHMLGLDSLEMAVWSPQRKASAKIDAELDWSAHRLHYGGEEAVRGRARDAQMEFEVGVHPYISSGDGLFEAIKRGAHLSQLSASTFRFCAAK